MRPQAAPHLVALLAQRAAEQPNELAFTFLGDGERPSDRMTWQHLYERSRTIAATLASHVEPGDRVLVAYPAGLEFLAGFFGCLAAGAIAVPVQLPRANGRSSAGTRFEGILEDARPTAVVTNASALSLVDRCCGESPADSRTRPHNPSILATDQLVNHAGNQWTEPVITPDTIAFLQYTSGSTTLPRGVMVSHGNVMHNLGAAFAMSTPGPVEASVSWLPFTHDMGLIEGLLQPVLRGHHAVVMSPASFLQRPARWLRAISTFRAARSGGPNFAYDLVARRVSDDELDGLDLSCWRDAYNGAEPVRHETLAAFAHRLARAGFRPEALRPSYGLAEATLLVACGRWDGSANGCAPCGTAAPDTTIAIVDPITGTRVDPGALGEIWVAGPGVAQGYWGQDATSAAVFGARLDADGHRYLRTGDLGRVDAGGLHITGRIKDVLIVRGQKHFPVDLEMTAARAHPAALPSGIAAFAAGAGIDGDRIVIAIEVDRHWDGPAEPANAVVAAVRGAIVDTHGVPVDDVVLLRPRSLPRTTSGKVQRHLCRDRWHQGQLLPTEVGST